MKKSKELKELRVIVKEDDGTKGKVVIDNSTNTEYLYPARYGVYNYVELEKLNDIKFREATFEEKLEFIKEDFSWGEVIKIHTIGEYQIIEYKEKLEGCILFHIYRNFNNRNNSYETLEQAITGAIFEKYDGLNSQLNSYVWKILSND